MHTRLYSADDRNSASGYRLLDKFSALLCLILVTLYTLLDIVTSTLAFAFLFSQKVHGPEVGQRWEYLSVSNSRDEIGVINVTARSNFNGGTRGEAREQQGTLGELPFETFESKAKWERRKRETQSRNYSVTLGSLID